MTVTASSHTGPSTGSSRARRWRHNSNGWMVGLVPARANQRPRYWCGPDLDAGFSATPRLEAGTDALVWPTADSARADLARVFEGDIDYYAHGYRIVPVAKGAPAGPASERLGRNERRFA